MPRTIVATLVLAAALLTGRALAGEPAKDTKDKEKAAEVAATAWLNLVDTEKYADSWKEAAAYFKANVKQDQWVQTMQGGRKSLGKQLSRKLKGATYTTTAPGAPDGEYVILQFDTSFESKKAAVETVTPMLDKDGKWHVSGYFIK